MEITITLDDDNTSGRSESNLWDAVRDGIHDVIYEVIEDGKLIQNGIRQGVYDSLDITEKQLQDVILFGIIDSWKNKLPSSDVIRDIIKDALKEGTREAIKDLGI